MSDLIISLVVIFALFFVGALFSAAEMSLVTLRDSQISRLASKGRRGAALQELTANPNRFLSSVQIGVTLAGFLSAAFGSDSLAGQFLVPWLVEQGMNQAVASVVGVVVITALVSFGSIVLSELTAKRLAMQRPEEFSLALAPLINMIAKVCRPIIWLLGKCTNAMVRVLGGDPQASKEAVTAEELRSMVANADTLGVEERAIVDDVFDAGSRSLREIMIPRTEVDFLDGDLSAYQALRYVQNHQRSRYPVIDGTPDQVIGFVHVRDLMGLDLNARNAPVKQLARPITSLPQTVKVLRAMTTMRRKSVHLAIVLDEYGGTAGIVTLEDIIEELIGDITDEYDVVDASALKHKQLSDVDGLTTIEDFAELSGFQLPEGPYDTLAGYFMNELGRIPELNDSITVRLDPVDAVDDDPDSGVEMTMTVTEMDGRRIAWIDVTSGEQTAREQTDKPIES